MDFFVIKNGTGKREESGKNILVYIANYCDNM